MFMTAEMVCSPFTDRHYPFYQLSDALFLQHVVYLSVMTKDPELIIIQFLVDQTFLFARVNT